MSKTIKSEQVVTPQTRETPTPGSPNQNNAQQGGFRRNTAQKQPVQKSTDPNTIEGRQNILHDFIMSVKEISRAANAIEKSIAKNLTQEQVNEGLVPFIQDLGVYAEPNIVKLRDSIAPKAYQELKKATANLLQIAREQKKTRDSTPAPAAKTESCLPDDDFRKKSLKEVFDWSEE